VFAVEVGSGCFVESDADCDVMVRGTLRDAVWGDYDVMIGDDDDDDGVDVAVCWQSFLSNLDGDEFGAWRCEQRRRRGRRHGVCALKLHHTLRHLAMAATKSHPTLWINRGLSRWTASQ